MSALDPAFDGGVPYRSGACAQHILILSVSAGAGHVRAAQALEAAARSASPPIDATHLDLLTLVPKEFRKLYAEQYIKLVDQLPQLWSYLYSKSDRPSRDTLIGKLKRAVEKLNTRKLDAEIARLAPDAILCTHFLPAELLSRHKPGEKRPTPCRRCGSRSRTSTCTRCGCTRTWIATAWPATRSHSGSRIAACRATRSRSPASR